MSSIGPAAQYQGFGIFQKTGTSTWTLTGTTSAITPWTINQGTVAISSDGSLGNVTGGITFNGGTLQTTAAVISGRSIALQAGGGTIDTVANNDVLSGPITGAGALSKLGTGALTLAGASSYTGAINVNAGTLLVDGAVAGATVFVNGGATLGGIGTVGATFVNGGTLAPGDAIGTLNVHGNLAFTGASTYAIQVSPTQSDKTASPAVRRRPAPSMPRSCPATTWRTATPS